MFSKNLRKPLKCSASGNQKAANICVRESERRICEQKMCFCFDCIPRKRTLYVSRNEGCQHKSTVEKTIDHKTSSRPCRECPYPATFFSSRSASPFGLIILASLVTRKVVEEHFHATNSRACSIIKWRRFKWRQHHVICMLYLSDTVIEGLRRRIIYSS